MATETTTQSTSTRTRTPTAATPSDAVQTAVREVRGAIENVGRSVPDVARASRVRR